LNWNCEVPVDFNMVTVHEHGEPYGIVFEACNLTTQWRWNADLIAGSDRRTRFVIIWTLALDFLYIWRKHGKELEI